MIPDLPDRFLAPKGWRTHAFVNQETGHKIHYGSIFPQRDEPPRAVIVCLGGLSEFGEKYYELAHDMLDRGYAFWFIDWAYQGRSSRLPKFPHRRHSDGFQKDVSDLHKLVADYIKPSSVHPDRGRIPMIMLAHSFGGNIGLQFLAAYPKFFDAAAFSAPFLGIYNFTAKQKIQAKIVGLFSFLVSKLYASATPDWAESMRQSDGSDIFSGDPVRDAVHNHWLKADTVLQVGGVTYGWVLQALKSCAALKKPGLLESIKVPVLIGLAEDDRIVDNECIRAAAKRLPNAQLLEIKGARHEILMERDEIRGEFLKAFDKMVEDNKIATIENLKPF